MNPPADSFSECYKCKSANPLDKKFCGDCGTSLDPTVGAINAYLDANLARRLDEAIKARFQDQQVTEVALAANVAEKVTNWAKLFVILIGVPLTITGTYLTYLGINYKDSLKKATTEINQAIESNRRDFDELNKRLRSSQTGANEIEKQEAVLRDKLRESSGLLQQVPSLVQKVDNLQDKIRGVGADLVPQFIKERKAIGIDVSHFDQVKWPDLKSAGVSFAYIKATQGITFVDPKFNENWQQAKSARIIRGAYHFLAGGDAVGQADYFVQHLHLEPGDLPPAVAFEPYPNGPSATTADLKLFLKLVEQKTNCTPIIYSGHYLIDLLSDSSDKKEIGKYPLWLARYGSTPAVPLPWTSWTFWQFTDGLSIKNLPAVDFNGFNGSDSELREFAKRSCTGPHS
jgi:lysozyme